MEITKEMRRESYDAILPSVKQRQSLILDLLRELGQMTAQEVADELHRRGYIPSGERNFAAPRLTEMKDAGIVIAVGKKNCVKTGRNVTIWAERKE